MTELKQIPTASLLAPRVYYFVVMADMLMVKDHQALLNGLVDRFDDLVFTYEYRDWTGASTGSQCNIFAERDAEVLIRACLIDPTAQLDLETVAEWLDSHMLMNGVSVKATYAHEGGEVDHAFMSLEWDGVL